MTKYVAYYRVSTKAQGHSGLEAQRTAVAGYIKNSSHLVSEFVEVESGKRNNRPQLQAAIDYAKAHRARLIIAKLDRLSRNAGFIFALKESDVDFICADMPDANILTIGIFATLAQHELISSRTKATLQAKKKKGARLGSPDNLTYAHRQTGGNIKREIAQSNENNRRTAALIKSYRNNGLNWLTIAQELNKAGFKTSRGKDF
jgi:DNA invertase Pin-like site-specific DNA recombinase